MYLELFIFTKKERHFAAPFKIIYLSQKNRCNFWDYLPVRDMCS